MSVSPRVLVPFLVAGAALAQSRPLPVQFVPNHGQWPAAVRYVARSGPVAALLGAEGLDLRVAGRGPGGTQIQLRWDGHASDVVGDEALPTRYHFLLGRDARAWRHDVPAFGRVAWRGVRPGVDVVVRPGPDGLEYDLELAPGARADAVTFTVAGHTGPLALQQGELLIPTAAGPLRHQAPVAWQTDPSGVRQPVASRFQLVDGARYRLTTDALDPRLPTTVDPGILWATFLGGASTDLAEAVALDSQGDVVLCGQTTSAGMPGTAAAFDPSYNGATDGFVARLSADGQTLLWATFVGGSGYENATTLALDAAGQVTVAGSTTSVNFPITAGALSGTYRGGASIGDGFVLRLSANGSALLWSTFLGGQNDDSVQGVALDVLGNVVVAGWTASSDFPTTPGAYDTTFNGGAGPGDAFVASINAAGPALQLNFATFYGGSLEERANGLMLGQGVLPVIVGHTISSDLPVTSGAFQTSYAGGLLTGDAFVARLDPQGRALLMATYLGGSDDENARAVAAGRQGEIVVVGETASPLFPVTAGAFDQSYNGNGDGFVTALANSGSALLWSTFLGGSNTDTPYAVAVDARNEVLVAGATMSAGFPITAGSLAMPLRGFDQAFITRLAAGGASLRYSTLLGGTWFDRAYGIACDQTLGAVVVGYTNMPDFPVTAGAFDTSYNGNGDGFVTHLDLLPTGAARFGASTPGCDGVIPLGVSAMPRIGTASFAVTCARAPASSAGFLLLTLAPLPAPIPVLGVDLWVDPTRLLAILVAVSNGLGAADFALPLPNDPTLQGGVADVQALWLSTCQNQGLAASHGLALTLQ